MEFTFLFPSNEAFSKFHKRHCLSANSQPSNQASSTSAVLSWQKQSARNTCGEQDAFFKDKRVIFPTSCRFIKTNARISINDLPDKPSKNPLVFQLAFHFREKKKKNTTETQLGSHQVELSDSKVKFDFSCMHAKQ